MKNLKTFQEFVNESINEAFASFDSYRPTLQARLDGIEEDARDNDVPVDDMCNMNLLRKQFDLASKALKTPINKCATTDTEGSYELTLALNIGLKKRIMNGDANIKLVDEIQFNSPWDSRNTSHIMSVYHIVDAKLDVITYSDGDDHAEFESIIFPENQKAKLLKWVNSNMSEEDMEY